MVVDAVAGPPGDVGDDGAQPVSSISRLRPQPEHTTWWWWAGVAVDVRMLAGRQVEPLDGAQTSQHLQRPEDGRPADAEASLPGGLDERPRP